MADKRDTERYEPPTLEVLGNVADLTRMPAIGIDCSPTACEPD